MDFAIMLLTVGLGWKMLDFVKVLRAGEWNGVVTQLASWTIGVGLVFLASGTDFAEQWALPTGLTLQDVNGATKVMIGLALLSSAGVLYDFKKAFDTSDTAVQPSLLSGETKMITPPPPTTVHNLHGDGPTVIEQPEVVPADATDAEIAAATELPHGDLVDPVTGERV